GGGRVGDGGRGGVARGRGRAVAAVCGGGLWGGGGGRRGGAGGGGVAVSGGWSRLHRLRVVSCGPTLGRLRLSAAYVTVVTSTSGSSMCTSMREHRPSSEMCTLRRGGAMIPRMAERDDEKNHEAPAALV